MSEIEQNYKPRGYWLDEKNVREAIMDLIDQGIPLSKHQMSKAGYGGLYKSIQNHHGGITLLARKISEESGLDFDYPGYWEFEDNVLRRLSQFKYFPTKREMTKSGLTTLYKAINKYHGGLEQIQSKSGLPNKKRLSVSKWTEDQVFHTIRQIIEEKGNLPTISLMKKEGYGGLINAIYNMPGGFETILDRLDITKQCSKCNRVLNINRFFRNKKTGGFSFICRECWPEYQRLCKYRDRPHYISNLVSQAKSRANKKELDFNLDKTSILELLERQNNQCALTGITLEFSPPLDGIRNPNNISIDRIDSSKGYVDSNVRLVCWAINNALNSYGDENLERVAIAYLSRKGYKVSHLG